MFESVKSNPSLTPTDTDSFMTFYGLDIANKIITQQNKTEEEIKNKVPPPAPAPPAPAPPAPAPILKKDDFLKDNIKQQEVSFVEELSSNEDPVDSKKIISQLNNDSDEEED